LAKRLLALLLLSLLAGCTHAEPAPDEAAIKAHLERYFTSWSAKDMDAYAACFDPQARILFHAAGRVGSEGLTDFLASQRMAHQTASGTMTEVPTKFTIGQTGDLATAHVRWELRIEKAASKTGTDVFTLVKTSSGWRIATLVWTQD
jgi:ketosteroid isomerase-like protein